MSSSVNYFQCNICQQIFEDKNILFNHGCDLVNLNDNNSGNFTSNVICIGNYFYYNINLINISIMFFPN